MEYSCVPRRATRTDWSIRFSADNGSFPGTMLLSAILPAAQLTRQGVGTGLFGGNTVTVYEFRALFPAFNAVANTPYI